MFVGGFRTLAGRVTKIPYFLGGGVLGGNDGSSIFCKNLIKSHRQSKEKEIEKKVNHEK